MGSSFVLNHVGMPRVSPTLKLDCLHRQVVVSRHISGGRAIWVVLEALNYQVEHHVFSWMPRPYLRKVQPLVARILPRGLVNVVGVA